MIHQQLISKSNRSKVFQQLIVPIHPNNPLNLILEESLNKKLKTVNKSRLKDNLITEDNNHQDQRLKAQKEKIIKAKKDKREIIRDKKNNCREKKSNQDRKLIHQRKNRDKILWKEKGKGLLIEEANKDLKEEFNKKTNIGDISQKVTGRLVTEFREDKNLKIKVKNRRIHN